MRPEVLSLGASHFQRVCEALKAQDSFSDTRKTQFRQDLVSICYNLMKYDFMRDPTWLIKTHGDYLRAIFLPWAMALDMRNAYTLSQEMRAILDNLCRLWVNDYDKFIFTAADGNFSCGRYASDWDVLMDNIYQLYKVRPSYQLVMFRIPKHLNNDFLFVGSLYHEMGHFVEAYYDITERVLDRIKIRLGTPTEEVQIRDIYFPFIKTTYENDICTNVVLREKILREQISEYVSDLFGTQYLGLHIGNHIEYVASGHYNIHDREHPSPICRRKMEESFLNDDRSNFVYADIFDEFAASNHPLRIRFVRPQHYSILDKGDALELQNDEELHSLLWYGWEVYLRGPQAMANAQGNPTKVLSNYEFYLTINEAIRESIKRYIAKNKT